ncbi:flagellar basal body-associated protein FliL [Shimia sp.]|uniref:flagellar basal body-associated FliL family protein n=1 Tax=Shimia sp. TaxID=1954381 RepID=UPI00356899FC
MAKPAKKKAKEKAPEEAGGEKSVAARSASARKLLMAAVLMSVASLGGGFFLARMAYLQDASAYEPDYVAEDGETAEGHGTEDGQVVESHGIQDPLAKDGHPAADAQALQEEKKGDGKDEDGEAVADNGLLDFGALMTNIHGFDAQGAPTKAFLKVAVVMVYRPEEGAAAMVKDREPFMRDLFNSYLRGLHEVDVRGMAGVLHLKAELLKRARAAMGNDLPQEILINDLIVQ